MTRPRWFIPSLSELALNAVPVVPERYHGLFAAARNTDKKVNLKGLIRVAGRDIAGNPCAFFKIAADRDVGGRRATAVGLLKTAVTTIEAGDHPLLSLAGRRFGVDQRFHLLAPLLA